MQCFLYCLLYGGILLIMRNNIVHDGAGELEYEIRGIVEIGEKLEKMGISMWWENIGDPVAKGESVPEWIKDIIANASEKCGSFAYVPTKGINKTRKFIADIRKKESGVFLDPEDILFFNGLGDAISIIYTYLNRHSRVIGPTPAYPTHSSAEGAHAGSRNITYKLNPKLGWLPDLEDLRNKVKYNPSISAILIINPDNPTGLVYPQRVLKEIVNIAREFDLFLISDEVYGDIYYGQNKAIPLCELVGGDVPAIIMKGLSKEVPWPGARCGWIEVYNKEKDSVFARYVKTLVDAKQLEVCSTTLPQTVLPEILGDERHKKHLKERSEKYKKRADFAHKVLERSRYVLAPKPEGAFYLSVVFRDGVLNNKQSLPIKDKKIKEYIEEKIKNSPPDQRFVYYLMASAGICVVPLSGFNTNLEGFRITLLEEDDKVFENNIKILKKAIDSYVEGKQ